MRRSSPNLPGRALRLTSHPVAAASPTPCLMPHTACTQSTPLSHAWMPPHDPPKPRRPPPREGPEFEKTRAYLEEANHMTVCDSSAVSTAQGRSGVAPCGNPCCPISVEMMVVNVSPSGRVAVLPPCQRGTSGTLPAVALAVRLTYADVTGSPVAPRGDRWVI